MTVPVISLVIVNRDDRGIVDTLRGLEGECARAQWKTEVIVVDASEGRLDDVHQRFAHVRWVAFPARRDKATIAEQRNRGVAESTGEIIVFLDASCVPDRDWLPTLVTPLLEEGEQIVAGAHRSTGRPGIRDVDRHFVGDDRYIEAASTLNLAVRRSVFTRVGGFDENFSYGSDFDFSWRAVDAGLRIRYVPAAVVTHDWGGWRSELRRSYVYGQARYQLYAKHARRRRSAWREDLVSLVYPSLLLGSPLLVVAPWLALVLIVPIVKNLRHRPLLTVIHHLVYAAGILRAGYRHRLAPGS